MQRWRYHELLVESATVEDGRIVKFHSPKIVGVNGDAMEPMNLIVGLDVLGEGGWELVAVVSDVVVQGTPVRSRFYLKNTVELTDGTPLGQVTHFYDRISVAVVKLAHDVRLGESVRFVGRHTDFVQELSSMQKDREPIEQASIGSEVAIKTDQPVEDGDQMLLYLADA